MRYIVTGGSGFIGSNFIRRILKIYDDIEIINIDALKYGSNSINLKDLKGNENYFFIKDSICNYSIVSELIKKSNAIINFAAETHVDRSISAPEAFLQTNVFGTFTILEAIRRENPNIKLVHISTDEVYGDILKGSYKETDAIKPSSPYSASKAASDAMVMGYSRTYGLDASITRCTNNYGPFQFPEKLIPKTIIRASKNLRIPIYGSGKNIRDWIHVEDHCRAIEAVLNSGKAGEIYNISSGDEKTNIEIVNSILSRMNKDCTNIEFVEERPGHDIRYSLDSSKIRKELNWEPFIRIDQGLEDTIHWYQANIEWWNDLLDDKIISPTPWKLSW